MLIGDYARWALDCGRAPGGVYIRTRYLHRLAERVDLLTATEADLLTWMGEHDWRPETRRSARATLSSFYGWLRAQGLRDDDPVARIPRTPIPPPSPHPASDVAVARARLAATPAQQLMVDLAALCGLRRAEIAGLCRDDLDGDLLTVRGKGQRTRMVPVPTVLADRLEACPPGPIFPGRFGGCVTPDHVGRVLSRLLGPGVTAHHLRHRYASRIYSATGDVLALSELLGHSSPVTTRRYVRVGMDHLRAVAAAAG